MGTSVFAGLRWSAEGAAARLHVDPQTEELHELEDRIALSVRERTHFCTGHVDMDAGTTRPCPDHAALLKGVVCARCRSIEGLWPCISCTGAACADKPLRSSVRAYCESPHLLYLAWFGKDVVKVGTASQRRGAERLWEQGALTAAFIAQGTAQA